MHPACQRSTFRRPRASCSCCSARIQGAQKYPGAWHARWLQCDLAGAGAPTRGGRLITLESDPEHAEVARANFRRTGFAGIIELRLGPALDTLDASTDLAVLKCAEATSAIAEISDVSSIRPGSLVLVVGRTRASGPVAALGAVSLVVSEQRSWTGAVLTPYVRIDVGLQPTAVGGVVVDAAGHVIGIATPRFARFGAIAVPTATVNRVVDTLLEKGRIPRGYLGVGLQTIQLPEALRQLLQRDQKTAVIVLEVEPDGPANKAGFVIGDILGSVGDRPVSRVEDVHAQLAAEAIGKSLVIKYFRGGALREAGIVVGERSPRGR